MNGRGDRSGAGHRVCRPPPDRRAGVLHSVVYRRRVDPDEAESDLLARFRALDPGAWETVYRRSYSRMHDYARRRLPRAHDADDAVSECLARAVHRIGDLADRGLRVEAWLYGILRLVVLEHVRRSSREQPAEEVESPPGPGPLDQLLDRELTASVRAAFERLGPEDQEVLWLRLVAGLSSGEVATVVGRREGAVRQAQSRALARLRKGMEEVHDGR